MCHYDDTALSFSQTVHISCQFLSLIEQIGDGIYLMLPFVKLHERIKYGGYASNTAMDGFAKRDAAVMIVQSPRIVTLLMLCSMHALIIKINKILE